MFFRTFNVRFGGRCEWVRLGCGYRGGEMERWKGGEVAWTRGDASQRHAILRSDMNCLGGRERGGRQGRLRRMEWTVLELGRAHYVPQECFDILLI